jgi:cytoskeletal protein CcmA (bactofilin family)
LGLLGVCEKLVFSGEAGNGITAGGFDIAVDGKITGNNYVASGTLHLGEAAVINGNLFAAGGKVLVDGTINGDLYAAAGQIVINSAINGNVVAYGGRVTIGEKGRIQGSLTYAAKEKLSSAELARVGGVTKVSEACKPKENNNFTTGLMIVFCLVVVLSTMIAGILLLFLPASEGLDATQTGRAFWITSLWGLIPILMYPAAVVLGFVLIVTIPVSLVLIFALIPLFFVANIIGTALLGKYIVRLFKWNVRRRHYQFLIGVAAAAILSLIPGVNFLTMLLLCSLGWGVYLSFLFKKDLAA